MKNKIELYEQTGFVASPEAQVELVVANTRLVLQRGRITPLSFLALVRYISVRFLGLYRKWRGL